MKQAVNGYKRVPRGKGLFKQYLASAGSAFISALSLLPHAKALAAEAQAHELVMDELNIVIETATDRLTDHFGPRFDRTAMVSSVQIGGVEFLGPWGLADEFGLHGDGVLGFETASIGERFTKIGLGELVKDAEHSYEFSRDYPIHQLFPIDVSRNDTSLTVTQTTSDTSQWPYQYSKTYTLLPNAQLRIDYSLTNLGTVAWTFEHYNHHWFLLEDEPIGAAYSVSTAFPLPEAPTGLIRAMHSLTMPGPLVAGEAQYYASDLNNAAVNDGRFEVRVNGELTVSFKSNTQPDRFAMYADPDGFCPEVFTRQTVEPRQTLRWQSLYQFRIPVANTAGKQ